MDHNLAVCQSLPGQLILSIPLIVNYIDFMPGLRFRRAGGFTGQGIHLKSGARKKAKGLPQPQEWFLPADTCAVQNRSQAEPRTKPQAAMEGAPI